jgi:hypothetical protein
VSNLADLVHFRDSGPLALLVEELDFLEQIFFVDKSLHRHLQLIVPENNLQDVLLTCKMNAELAK